MRDKIFTKQTMAIIGFFLFLIIATILNQNRTDE